MVLVLVDVGGVDREHWLVAGERVDALLPGLPSGGRRGRAAGPLGNRAVLAGGLFGAHRGEALPELRRLLLADRGAARRREEDRQCECQPAGTRDLCMCAHHFVSPSLFSIRQAIAARRVAMAARVVAGSVRARAASQHRRVPNSAPVSSGRGRCSPLADSRRVSLFRYPKSAMRVPAMFNADQGIASAIWNTVCPSTGKTRIDRRRTPPLPRSD